MMKRNIQVLSAVLIVMVLLGCNGSNIPSVDEGSLISETVPSDFPLKNSNGEAPLEIVWIGDSLTQGSLGDDNHNTNNPQAPYKVFAEMTDIPVRGYGYYGYNAHDCFWKYGEDGGSKNTDNLYVLWVGSNDWVANPTDVETVIAEIDKFIDDGSLKDYLILGTTNRLELIQNDAYQTINKALEEKYQSRYLDIISCVEFSEDGVHLTEQSYADIATAVMDKLVDLSEEF